MDKTAPTTKSFNAKVLLFGEYSILNGSYALAIPNSSFSGSWTYQSSESKETARLKEWGEFLMTSKNHASLNAHFNHEQFFRDLTNGLYFKSNIPIGYGLGSSGAISAAMYQKYFSAKNNDHKSLRADLSIIERFFHGKSSGLDPLVSYLNQPIAIQKDGKVEALQIDLENITDHFFLIDTLKKRNTADLVNTYKAQLEEQTFSSLLSNQYIPIVNSAIKTLIEGQPFWATMKKDKPIPIHSL